MILDKKNIIFNHNCIWQIRRQYGLYFCEMLIVKFSSEIIDKTRNGKRKIYEKIYHETDTLAFIYTNFDIKILSFE